MIIKISHIKSKFVQAAFLLVLISTVACTGPQSKYNTIDISDPNAGSDYVYGNIDGPPLQANHQYEADPEVGARINGLRDKMFGSPTGAEAGVQQNNPGQ
ncbi:hypothetical protein Q0590_19715 [Rhodocytophaga aerolata]|uniref:Uncharacterized protein n=1 Tax=Rhodocytophaga aerolata TaxID=455078 RepID=A0ABT8R8V5_9BACT|nr:hypothetical protein [Rhodocytophaga aerolata]MDO1448514.1 hypothetical protein [Rhodocytophaga aerolata]